MAKNNYLMVSLIVIAVFVAMALGYVNIKDNMGGVNNALSGKIVNVNDNLETVKIGSINPLSGRVSYLGIATANGARLAIKDIRKEHGVDALKVVFEDSKGNPAEAVLAAKKLMFVDYVDVVFSELTGTSLAVSPAVLEQNKPLVYLAFTKNIIDDNALSIKTFLNFDDACEEFMGLGYDEDNILVIDQTKTNGESCLKGLKRANNEFNYDLELIDAGGDYKTILLKAKRDNYDRIIPLCYESTCLNIIKQMIELGIEIPLFCNKDNCATEKIVEAIGIENMPETIYFVQDVNEEYVEKYKAEYGEDSSDADIIYSSTGYDVIKSIFNAVRKCPDKKSECIIEKFSEEKSSVDSAMNYIFENRVMVPEIGLYEIMDGKVELLK
jgi:ABC-type branched-subunit amino acid transport system substrate-binding protein